MTKAITIVSAILLFCSCQQASQFNFQSKASGENSIAPVPEGHMIAYNTLVDPSQQNFDVFIMNSDGSEKKNLTQRPGVDWVYHSVNGKLYFISDRDTTQSTFFLYEMDHDGENVRRVTDFRVTDSWLDSRSNGSEFIIRPHDSVDSTHFYIIDLNGNVLQQIATGLEYFQDPHFSPDGSRIVFRGSENKYLPDNDYMDELYIMNADGTDLRQLTQYPNNDATNVWWEYHAGPPVWRNDSDIITFQSVQKKSSSLFGISPNGKDLNQITPDSTYDGWHSWSENDEWLVMSRSVIKAGNFNYDIYLKHRDSTNVRRLTTEATIQQAPVFVIPE